MELPEIVVAPEDSFDALYGMRHVEFDEHSARGEVDVRREILQPWGVVHGGIYAAMAESLASWATALVVVPQGNMAMGLSNNTSFLRPISKGTIHGLATRRHRGRMTWVWDVDISDDEGHLCATSRVTVAVRALGESHAAGGGTDASQPR